MDLRTFDIILVNSSAGKDSQVMLDVVCTLAREQDVLDKVTVLHNDLGEVEWPGTAELAAQQVARYGVRFEMRHREQGLLLEQVEQRGKWPSKKQRWCTSDQKRGPKRKLMTQLVRELALDRPVLILDCNGERAEESSDRANKAPFEFDQAASNKTRRHVWAWRPIHDWTAKQVWQRIRETGVPYHWAYDQGMTRLSCSLCILAPKAQLIRAAQLRPDLARKYALVEKKVCHRFRQDLSMQRIIELAAEQSATLHRTTSQGEDHVCR